MKNDSAIPDPLVVDADNPLAQFHSECPDEPEAPVVPSTESLGHQSGSRWGAHISEGIRVASRAIVLTWDGVRRQLVQVRVSVTGLFPKRLTVAASPVPATVEAAYPTGIFLVGVAVGAMLIALVRGPSFEVVSGESPRDHAAELSSSGQATPAQQNQASQFVPTSGADVAARNAVSNSSVLDPEPAPSLPYRGSIAINSRPQGAAVFMNDRRVGTTPVVLRQVPVGSSAVRVTLEGRVPWSRSIQVVANERTTIAAALEPSTSVLDLEPAASLPYRGSLAINSQPEGAVVFMNGRRVGTTPVVLGQVPVGSSAVRVILEGRVPWSRSIQIVANERTTIAAMLEPSTPGTTTP